MKKYLAIGHWIENTNITCVACKEGTKEAFRSTCHRNGFVPYVILTEKMLEKLQGMNCRHDVFEQVTKMTHNYRKWSDITDYIIQCMDIILKIMYK